MAMIDLRSTVREYINTADIRLLKMIKALAESYQEEITERDTIEQYNKEIDQGIAEIERGDFYTQEEVEKMAKEW